MSIFFTLQYSEALLQMALMSSLAACHGSGPLFDKRPMPVAAALITPIPLSFIIDLYLGISNS